MISNQIKKLIQNNQLKQNLKKLIQVNYKGIFSQTNFNTKRVNENTNLFSINKFQAFQKKFSTCPNAALKEKVNLATLSKHCYIEQVSTGCLAQFGYYIEADGKAVVIDPVRDVQFYVDLVKKKGVKLEYVFETHFHADFVSGHLELANKTNSKIVFGPNATAEFDIIQAKHEQIFPISDKIAIQVLHTPGHTMESSCLSILEKDNSGKYKTLAIATGDTIFLGEVGRPDLAVKTDLTKEDLAAHLFNSVNYLKKFPDDTIVLPGHGAGSACGKNIQSGDFSTIGIQKDSNYAMKDLSKEEFVTLVTANLPTPPSYFFHDAVMNKKNIIQAEQVLKNGMRALSPDEFEKLAKDPSVKVLDSRANAQVFEQGVLPLKVYSVDLKMNYAIWVATLFKPQDKILIVGDSIEESILRLTRVGFDNIIGYLDGGVEGWKKAGKSVANVSKKSTEETIKKIGDKNSIILDVRNPGEHKEPGVVEGSLLITLTELENKIAEVPKGKDIYVMCKSGMRATIAASILTSQGHKGEKVHVIGNGIDGFVEKQYKLVSV